MRMKSRLTAAVSIGVLAILVAIASARDIRAQTLEATWTLYSRANETSFAPGSPGSTTGYEIISFAAAGPADALETYQYGGADLDKAMVPIVTCGASVATTTVNLTVGNGYPYAGCVYLLGVSNTGQNPIRVNLGKLAASATVECSAAGCSRADIDIVAGGRTEEEVASLCSGPARHRTGLEYDVLPGDTFVCPVFVVVLQSAKESASYDITITPPPIDHSDEPETLDTPTPITPGTRPSPGDTSSPTPTATPTLTPTATPSPTPVEQAAGEKTQGPAASTPAPPLTGSGTLVQRNEASGLPVVGVLLLGLAGIVIALAWPRANRGGAG